MPSARARTASASQLRTPAGNLAGRGRRISEPRMNADERRWPAGRILYPRASAFIRVRLSAAPREPPPIIEDRPPRRHNQFLAGSLRKRLRLSQKCDVSSLFEMTVFGERLS